MKDFGSRIVKEEHIRFQLEQNGKMITGIGFRMAEKFGMLQISDKIDVVYTIDENEWNGTKTLQLKIIDFRPSA